MAKWAEIKCERCAEQDALWEGMERSLEESDAREARLEAKLAKVISLADAMAEAIEDQISICDASMDEQIAVKNYRTTLAELTGGKDAAAAIRKGGE